MSESSNEKICNSLNGVINREHSNPSSVPKNALGKDNLLSV